MSLRREAASEEARETAPLLDCEVRDFEAFSTLVPPSLQQAVLDAIQSGSAPRELMPLLNRLKAAGVLVCT
ncbi:MAG: hypothetical protein TU35_007760 [Thermoproteus sp. AZ2]|jgi:hypothetical protein|uniref:Uncharacterized protein n=1 Tax=Thermoproteus sp. AZ2 TaxID=1609232 RepID=A0ACC6V255_9CREN